MPWVKLDDNFPGNDKVLGLGADAFRLYVEALCHCGRNLTDGFVSTAALARLWHPAAASELVEACLWAAVDGGHEVNDYLSYNPSREQVEAERAAARERQSRRRSRGMSRRDTTRDSQGDSRRESHDPVPTRPDHEESSSSATAEGISTGPDDDPVQAAIAILAEGDLARRTGAKGPVGNAAAWTAAARSARRRDHAADLHRLHREHPDWSPAVLAATILDLEQPTPETPADSTVAAQAAAMERNARRAAGDVCQACEDTGWVPDDIGTGVHPCTCTAGAFAG